MEKNKFQKFDFVFHNPKLKKQAPPAQFQNVIPSKMLLDLLNFGLSGQINIVGIGDEFVYNGLFCLQRTLNFAEIWVKHIQIKRDPPVTGFQSAFCFWSRVWTWTSQLVCHKILRKHDKQVHSPCIEHIRSQHHWFWTHCRTIPIRWTMSTWDWLSSWTTWPVTSLDL